MMRSFKLASLPLALAALGLARPAFAVTDTYTFRDTLQSTEGGATGNTLSATYNNGTLVAGTFGDVTISASACANTPTVRGYSFPAFGGLKSLNTAPIVATGSYTITMIVKFSPLKGGYTRLIDFSDSTLDDGIYVLNNGVSFYPVGTYAPNSFQDDQFSVMTITRNAATDEVSLFIGLTAAGVYTDTPKRYVPNNGNLYFFMDNTTGAAAVSESSPGVVTFLRVSDQPITAVGLAASIDQACNAVACGNGKLEPAEGCDDGNNVDGDGCNKACKIENGKACNAAADAGVTGAPSCASATCGSSSLKCVPVGGCAVDGDCTSKQCDTQALTCKTTADAGDTDAGATEDASVADSGTTAGNDAGTSDTDAGAGGTASSGCSCDVGPASTRSSALALFVAGVVVTARRRIKRRAATRRA